MRSEIKCICQRCRESLDPEINEVINNEYGIFHARCFELEKDDLLLESIRMDDNLKAELF